MIPLLSSQIPATTAKWKAVAYLELERFKDHLGNLVNGDLIFLVHRQDDRLHLIVFPHHPEEQLGQIQGVDKLAQGLSGAPDLERLPRLLSNVSLVDKS